MSFDLKISNGDISLGQDGDLEKVEGIDKLVQDILKILMTPVGANVFFPWYGSILTEASIGQVLDKTFVYSMVNQTIRNSLEKLQNLQKNQLANGQSVSANEMLAAIKSIDIYRNTADPTYWSIYLKVLSKGLRVATAVLDVSL